jgi:hypothetical protein
MSSFAVASVGESRTASCKRLGSDVDSTVPAHASSVEFALDPPCGSVAAAMAREVRSAWATPPVARLNRTTARRRFFGERA